MTRVDLVDARVLVVGDHADTVRCSDLLDDSQCRVLRADEGWAVESALAQFRPDVAMVIAGEDPVDSLPVCRRLGAISAVPHVYVGTGLPPMDRLAAFDAGAEDVIDLFVGDDELLARMAVVLRRTRGQAGRTVLEFDDIVIDELAHVVVRAGETIELTSIEFSLLSTFLRNRGHVLSKVQILSMVWGFEHYDVNLVEVYVSALRKKIEAHGPRVLHTVRGVGYVLRPPVRALELAAS